MGRKTVAWGSAALALAFAGCGSAAPKQLSLAQFRRTAATICAQRRAAYATVAAHHHHDFIGAMRAVLPAAQRALDQLEGIRPPAALRGAYAQVLAVERHQKDATAVVARTGRLPANAIDYGTALQRHQAMRAQLGMEACD